MFQPSATLPSVPLKPSPWQLHGQGWIVAMRLPDGAKARDAFMPPSLQGKCRGNLAMLMFVDYAQSDCGPYHELLFVPGSFPFADGKYHRSISRILVSTWDSVVNGRINWGIPKDRCDFDVQYGVAGSREDHIVLRQDGRVMANLTFASLPLPVLPVFGAIIPERMRTLAQQFDGKTYLYAPGSRGWVQPGKLLSWKFDEALFPDLAGARVLGALKIRSFAMTFPVARILPSA